MDKFLERKLESVKEKAVSRIDDFFDRYLISDEFSKHWSFVKKGELEVFSRKPDSEPNSEYSLKDYIEDQKKLFIDLGNKKRQDIASTIDLLVNRMSIGLTDYRRMPEEEAADFFFATAFMKVLYDSTRIENAHYAFAGIIAKYNGLNKVADYLIFRQEKKWSNKKKNEYKYQISDLTSKIFNLKLY